MSEFFIVATSFAAPVFSDTSDGFVDADTPARALEKFAVDYNHPCGLYAAVCYASADAAHKGAEPLAKWLCNHELAKQEATKDLGSYSYLGHGPGKFEVNRQMVTVENPKDGMVVAP